MKSLATVGFAILLSIVAACGTEDDTSFDIAEEESSVDDALTRSPGRVGGPSRGGTDLSPGFGADTACTEDSQCTAGCKYPETCACEGGVCKQVT